MYKKPKKIVYSKLPLQNIHKSINAKNINNLILKTKNNSVLNNRRFKSMSH